MSKFKFSALISAVCLMGIILHSWVGFSQSPQPSVQLTTNPPVSQIVPFEAEATTPQSPVLLTLQALDKGGKPLENAKFSLTILTPPQNPWLPTDFPIVEGTKLLEMTAITPNGKLQIEQILPIRGTYNLNVKVTPMLENAFPAIEQTLTLSVPENWLKYRNFGILALILLAVGLGGGWVIGEKQTIQPGEIAPEPVRLLLSGAVVVAIAALLIINITGEMADSHQGHHSHHSHDKAQANHQHSDIILSQEIEAQLLGDETATVGIPANLGIKVTNTQTNQPLSNAILQIKTTQLEDEWVAFAYQGVSDATGKFVWQQQFFDGAPHQIAVKISPQANASEQFSPLQTAREIEVAGVAPPLRLRLTTLAYFTGIIALGLGLGLWLRQRQYA